MARIKTGASPTPPGKDDIRDYMGPGPNITGRLMVDTYRGTPRIRKWPKKRPGKRHPVNEWWSEWLSQGNRLYKHLATQIQYATWKSTRNTMLMPRDVFFMMNRGTLATIQEDDGTILYPVWWYWRMNDSLDVFSDEPGTILVRLEEGWAGLLPGPEGEVLTSQGEGEHPIWMPASGGGVIGTPPVLAAFTEQRTVSGTDIDEESGLGITMARQSGIQSQWSPRLLRPISENDTEIHATVTFASNNVSGHAAGICLARTDNDDWIRFALRWNQSSVSMSPTLESWDGDHSADVQIRRETWMLPHQISLGITINADGSYDFYWSLIPGNWQYFASIAAETHGAPFDLAGLSLYSRQLSSMATAHWTHYEHITD